MSNNESTPSAHRIITAFSIALTATDYRRTLRRARLLSASNQLQVLDALFASAARLRLDRTTGRRLPRTRRSTPTVIAMVLPSLFVG